uniref:Uncharacterized protein n=1 Tax=Populus alba TaxID=43335 RepID=A0A4U5PQU1_POPAL|nr:hypothetical protein D5086_0000196720 [Populus alba]
MKQRYVGHCNVGTDIKRASFLGQRGDYMAGVSDDGRWFIWEKRTGREPWLVMFTRFHVVSCSPFELLERFRMHEFTEGTLHLLSVLRANRACALLSLQLSTYAFIQESKLAAEVQVEPFFSRKNIRAKVSAT